MKTLPSKRQKGYNCRFGDEGWQLDPGWRPIDRYSPSAGVFDQTLNLRGGSGVGGAPVGSRRRGTLDAIERIVTAEAQASGAPRPPEITTTGHAAPRRGEVWERT